MLQVRRLVIFDGICVLCNKFGRYSFYRLVNKDLVSFVPFQDSQHVRCSSAVLRSAAEAERPTAQVNVDELQKQFNFGAPPDASPPPRST